MVKPSDKNARKRLDALLGRQRRLIAGILACAPLLRGSFTRVHTRCGKPNCWCARSPQGHPHARLGWSQDGTMITRKVPSEYVDTVVQWTQNHRRFRLLRHRLLALQTQTTRIIETHAHKNIQRLARSLPFLNPPKNLHAPTPAHQQNRARKTSGTP